MTSEHPVEVHGIRKKFGSVTALAGVSLSVPANSIYGVLGPNGAGKTTLFSILTGFMLPTEGTLSVLGTNRLETVRGRLSILPQDALFQTNIPIIDQLSFFLTLMGMSRGDAEREVLRVLRLVDLDQVVFREAGTLSHGMYKRLSLAQAFLGRPEVIILDEPTAGLDWKSAESIRGSIKRLRQEATVLVSSHNLEEMQSLCDHIAILDKGELVAAGPVDVVTAGATAIRLAFRRAPSDEELAAFRDIAGLEDLVALDDEWQFLIADDPGGDSDAVVAEILRRALARGLVPRKLLEENRLKRLYLNVTK